MAGKGIVVLGLDPGSRCTGYGLVSEESGCLRLVRTGTVRPQLDLPLSDRLGAIHNRLNRLIEEYKPDEAAVEDVFVSKNTSSALKLGQARGAALVACAGHNLPVFAYEPTLIKKTLAGAGRADKAQIAFMVGQLLGQRPNWSQDSSDALAAAICHLNMRRWQHMQMKAG